MASRIQAGQFGATMTGIVTLSLAYLAVLFMFTNFLQVRLIGPNVALIRQITEHGKCGSDFSPKEHFSKAVPIFQWGHSVRHKEFLSLGRSLLSLQCTPLPHLLEASLGLKLCA